MLVPACLLVVLASVPLLGGRLGALADLRWRGSWLLGAALGVQLAIMAVLPGGAPGLHRALHLVSYALAGAFVVVNRRVRGLVLIGAGGAANLVAIAANGGVMPTSPDAARAAGMTATEEDFANSAVLREPVLAPLGDVLVVPEVVAFSPGDAVLVLGAALLVHRACGTRLRRVGVRPRAARGSGG